MERRGGGARAADGGNFLDREVSVFARQRVPLCVADQNLCQRPDLCRFAVVTRGCDPGVFLLAIPTGECRLSFSGPWMQRLLALVVGMHHIFGDRLAKAVIGRSLEFLHAAEVAGVNVSTGQIVS